MAPPEKKQSKSPWLVPVVIGGVLLCIGLIFAAIVVGGGYFFLRSSGASTPAVEAVKGATVSAFGQGGDLASLPTQVPTAFVFPTVAPAAATSAAVPTEAAPAPTGAPAGPAALSPEDSLVRYWDFVSAKDYSNAWNMLSANFRAKAHDNNISNYENGYAQMNLCSVSAQSTHLDSNDGQTATVSAHIVYRLGADCAPSGYDFRIVLVYDAGQGFWLLDQLYK